MLELLLLELEPLLRGGDIHERAPYLGDVVEHLLVGIVEDLVWILGRVECLVSLRGDDVVCPLEETHGKLLPCNSGPEPGLTQPRLPRHLISERASAGPVCRAAPRPAPAGHLQPPA